MTCANQVFDEDGMRICSCGDEGRLCDACERAEAAYWLDQWKIAPLSETDPESYEEEIRDAGRGHLLPP